MGVRPRKKRKCSPKEQILFFGRRPRLTIGGGGGDGGEGGTFDNVTHPLLSVSISIQFKSHTKQICPSVNEKSSALLNVTNVISLYIQLDVIHAF